MNPRFPVGAHIRVASVFADENGHPITVGALPVQWRCSSGACITDPVRFPDGVSTVGHMDFIAVKGEDDVSLGFNDITGKKRGKHGFFAIKVDITPLPTITAQAVVIVAPKPPKKDTIFAVDFHISQ